MPLLRADVDKVSVVLQNLVRKEAEDAIEAGISSDESVGSSSSSSSSKAETSFANWLVSLTRSEPAKSAGRGKHARLEPLLQESAAKASRCASLVLLLYFFN